MKHTQNEPCLPGRRVVAQGPYCSIEECSCGVLHVTLGVLTIRLQSEVVVSVWQTMGEALARLHSEHSPKPAVPFTRAPGRPS